jgi:preprotein translocase subunit Sss1
MFDAYTVLFSLLIIGVYGFAIYFVITAITFMREKNNHTQ